MEVGRGSAGPECVHRQEIDVLSADELQHDHLKDYFTLMKCNLFIF